MMKKFLSLLLVLALALGMLAVSALAADTAVTTAAAAPAAVVTAGGKTVAPSAAAQEQYYASYFKDYNWYGPTSKPVNGETALAAKTAVYTYALPEGTASVTVSFPEAANLYAYEKKAEGELENWVAGYWSAAGTSYTVTFGAASSADDKTKTMTIDQNVYTFNTICLYVQDAKDGSLQYILEFTEPGAAAKSPFADVATDAWYYKDVLAASRTKILTGTSDTAFSPDAVMTRGMLVTALWNLEGKPAAKTAASFSDVADADWFAKAAAWASENKIVLGANGKFDPNTAVTREQFAAILYRYAKYKSYDVSVGEDTNILSYDDAFTISEYAIPAIQWACGAGILNGSGTALQPKAGASRAQAAALLVRFAASYVK